MKPDETCNMTYCSKCLQKRECETYRTFLELTTMQLSGATLNKGFDNMFADLLDAFDTGRRNNATKR